MRHVLTALALVPSVIPLWLAHAQWVRTVPTQERIMDIRFVDDDTGFAVSGIGPRVYRTTDGGYVWELYSTTPSPGYGVLSVCPVDDERIVVGTYGGGIYYSYNSGTTWHTASGTSNYIWSIVKAGSRLFASGGVIANLNGASWYSLYPALPTGDWAVFESEGEIIYAGGDPAGVYYSTDYGDTWIPVVPGTAQPRRITSMDIEGGKVFVGTRSEGVYYHDGSSGSWTHLAGPDTVIEGLAVVDPYVFAGAYDGKVSRCDYRVGTSSWSDVSSGLLPRYMIRAMAKNSTALFVGSQSAGVVRRELIEIVPLASVGHAITGPGTVEFNDPGHSTGITINFTAVGESGEVVAMLLGSPPANAAFAGTPPVNLSSYRWVIEHTGLGAFSAEIRLVITPYLSGIPNPNSVTLYSRDLEGTGQFTALATTYEPSVQELRATVTGFSEIILGSDDNPLTSMAAPPGLPMRTELQANYPNPFNPITTIGYTVGGTEHQTSGVSEVRLAVYDILGREVAVLVNEKKAPGRYEVRFDAAGLSSGVYFYCLTAGSNVQTRKMALSR